MAARHVESLFPNQGSNSYLIKHRVFILGPPRKSNFFGFLLLNFEIYIYYKPFIRYVS